MGEAKVAWDKVCLPIPKQEGGLGILNLESSSHDQAYLAHLF